MSKELDEALKQIKIRCHPKVVWDDPIDSALEIIEQALQRLESIDNANPSEALEDLKHIKKYYVPQPCSAKTYDYLETIEKALQRLESIDNAKPSEALECLHKIASKVELADNDDYWVVRNAYVKVENTLLKAQEQEIEVEEDESK